MHLQSKHVRREKRIWWIFVSGANFGNPGFSSVYFFQDHLRRHKGERESKAKKKKKKGKIVLKSRAAAILHFRRNSTIRWRRNRNSLDSLLLIFVDWRVWVMVSLNKWTHIKRISTLRSEKRLWATSSKQKRPKLRFKAERNCRVVSLMKKTHFLLRREKNETNFLRGNFRVVSLFSFHLLSITSSFSIFRFSPLHSTATSSSCVGPPTSTRSPSWLFRIEPEQFNDESNNSCIYKNG